MNDGHGPQNYPHIFIFSFQILFLKIQISNENNLKFAILRFIRSGAYKGKYWFKELWGINDLRIEEENLRITEI